MNISTPKVLFAHLKDDYSGSPKVGSYVIKSLLDKQVPVQVFTSKSRHGGFLSDIKEADLNYFDYRRSERFKLVTFINLLISQFQLFFKLFSYRNEDVIIYVNTLLPFGAALAGKFMNKKVVYHIHETSIRPLMFKWFLKLVANYCASTAVYVSKYALQHEALKKVNNKVVYNCLSPEFFNKSRNHLATRRGDFYVLMLCSLKGYKGVNEFVNLAFTFPYMKFELVLNASRNELDFFFAGKDLPENLFIYPAQNDVHRFYKRASVVLNLSKPDEWVETFGMTVLEAMSYGIPVVVPPVGGVKELVGDNLFGQCVDSRNSSKLEKVVFNLMVNQSLYRRFSSMSKLRSGEFDFSTFSKNILGVVFDRSSVQI